MATVTVRNLPDEVHRALRMRAAQHGCSTEAEIRDILASTVCPPERVGFGTAVFNLARNAGVTDEDIEALNKVRDRNPAEPLRFE